MLTILIAQFMYYIVFYLFFFFIQHWDSKKGLNPASVLKNQPKTTTVHRKKTFTGLCTKCDSITPRKFKVDTKSNLWRPTGGLLARFSSKARVPLDQRSGADLLPCCRLPPDPPDQACIESWHSMVTPNADNNSCPLPGQYNILFTHIHN